MASSPGFHGKSPARGDFLTRHIPPTPLAIWDDWLARLVQTTRETLGPAWLDHWLVAPIWHAAIGPFILSPDPWQAILIPSVDRVGRHFPFTILAARAPHGVAPEDWAAQAEPLILSALDDDFSPETLAAALVALGSPGPADTAPNRSTWHSETLDLHVRGLPTQPDCLCLVAPKTAAGKFPHQP